MRYSSLVLIATAVAALVSASPLADAKDTLISTENHTATTRDIAVLNVRSEADAAESHDRSTWCGAHIRPGTPCDEFRVAPPGGIKGPKPSYPYGGDQGSTAREAVPWCGSHIRPGAPCYDFRVVAVGSTKTTSSNARPAYPRVDEGGKSYDKLPRCGSHIPQGIECVQGPVPPSPAAHY